MEMFEVGGCVRDEILGTTSKDIDYTVVLDDEDFKRVFWQTDPFLVMHDTLVDMGFEIFLETPEHLTIRARFPKGSEHSNLTADFVLARKEGEYTDGRRPDSVEPGTLMDDLGRRDFTMNAIAKAVDGTLIDPFNGQADIAKRLIRTVGEPKDRLREDALRAVRALRFSVTKHMRIEGKLQKALLWDTEIHDLVADVIADERIAEELSKMLRFDTRDSLTALRFYPALTDAMLCGKVSLDATLKTKGRGK